MYFIGASNRKSTLALTEFWELITSSSTYRSSIVNSLYSQWTAWKCKVTYVEMLGKKSIRKILCIGAAQTKDIHIKNIKDNKLNKLN